MHLYNWKDVFVLLYVSFPDYDFVIQYVLETIIEIEILKKAEMINKT